MRLARSERERVNEIKRPDIKGPVRALGDAGRSRVTQLVIGDERDHAYGAVAHDLAHSVRAGVDDKRANASAATLRHQHRVGIGVRKFLPQALVQVRPVVLLVTHIAAIGRRPGGAVQAVQVSDLREREPRSRGVHALARLADDHQHLAPEPLAGAVAHAAVSERADACWAKDLRPAVRAVVYGIEARRPHEAGPAAGELELVRLPCV